MNYQTSKKGQQGQALILIALAAVGLFAFSALAIDGSRAFSNKRHAQNAADTSVLTAALTYIRTPSNTGNPVTDDQVKFAAAVAAAENRATSNGFTEGGVTGGPQVEVDVDRCNVVTCDGLPAGITEEEKKEFIRVRIVSTIPATFGRVIGRETLTSAAEAIARVQGDASNSTGNTTSGAAMVATKSGDYDQCFLLNGGANLTTHDSGIFVNCSGDQALFINGNVTYTMGADSDVAGCSFSNGNNTVTGGDINCNATPKVVDATTYASIPTMPAVPTCSVNGSYLNGNHLTPGNHQDIIVNNDTVMDPGVYCVNGNFNVNGQNKLSGTGTVKIVMANADFNVGSSSVYTFDDLEIFTVNKDFQMQGDLTANRLRFYSSGSGKSIVNSQSKLTSPNAYFYLHRGTINWNGGTNVHLTAPPDGDPYAGGILVHMPWENTSAANINGGSNTLIYGTFLMPHSNVTFNGGTTFELHSQVIAYEYIVNGGGKIDIYYLANSLINPPNVTNPTIELTK